MTGFLLMRTLDMSHEAGLTNLLRKSTDARELAMIERFRPTGVLSTGYIQLLTFLSKQILNIEVFEDDLELVATDQKDFGLSGRLVLSPMPSVVPTVDED